MKNVKILITGKNGYIASNLKSFLEGKGEYRCDIIDLQSDEWKNISFFGYDVIIHTSALVHQKERKHSLDEYIKINCNLTGVLARKAKKEKIKQFIFFSTEAVYGLSPSVNRITIINGKTPTTPKTKYGISKLMAEEALLKLEDDTFSVAILRCPIIYGKGCKGNYNVLRNIALKFLIFPKIKNKKSFLYIGNLCYCIKHIIDIKYRGYISPQNKECSSTREIVHLIKNNNNKKGYYSFILGLFMRLLSFVRPIKKAFGNSYIDESLSQFDDGWDYRFYSLEDSIMLTEKK